MGFELMILSATNEMFTHIHDFNYSIGQTSKSSVPNTKSLVKTDHVEKNTQTFNNSQNPIHEPPKPAPPETAIHNPEQPPTSIAMNMNQDEPQYNNATSIINYHTADEDQENSIITIENITSQENNEEDMIM